MSLDNEKTQSMVAYEDGPKELRDGKGMPDGNKQFGKGNKMPQENKGYRQRDYPANPTLRHGEYR